MALSDDVMDKTKDVLRGAVQGALIFGLIAAVATLAVFAWPAASLLVGGWAASSVGVVAALGHAIAIGFWSAVAGGAFFGLTKLFPGIKDIGNLFKPTPKEIASRQAREKQHEIEQSREDELRFMAEKADLQNTIEADKAAMQANLAQQAAQNNMPPEPATTADMSSSMPPMNPGAQDNAGSRILARTAPSDSTPNVGR